MRLRIAHETTYGYAEPARGLLQIMRMTPATLESQRVLRWRIEPSVEGRLVAGRDHFGNVTHAFSADDPLSEVRVAVRGEVQTYDTAGIIQADAETLPASCFLRTTDLTAPDNPIRELAQDAGSGGPSDVLSILHRLMSALHQQMSFEIATTSSTTRAAEAYALKRGVCQDITHIFLAAARYLAVPSRYVSGYFHRNDGVVEQTAGHAWAEALIPGLGWIGFDPTNGICVTDAHVRVAIALDYLGAAPVRGSRRGGGSERMDVRVRVEDLGGAHQAQQQG